MSFMYGRKLYLGVDASWLRKKWTNNYLTCFCCKKFWKIKAREIGGNPVALACDFDTMITIRKKGHYILLILQNVLYSWGEWGWEIGVMTSKRVRAHNVATPLPFFPSTREVAIRLHAIRFYRWCISENTSKLKFRKRCQLLEYFTQNVLVTFTKAEFQLTESKRQSSFPAQFFFRNGMLGMVGDKQRHESLLRSGTPSRLWIWMDGS